MAAAATTPPATVRDTAAVTGAHAWHAVRFKAAAVGASEDVVANEAGEEQQQEALQKCEQQQQQEAQLKEAANQEEPQQQHDEGCKQPEQQEEQRQEESQGQPVEPEQQDAEPEPSVAPAELPAAANTHSVTSDVPQAAAAFLSTHDSSSMSQADVSVQLASEAVAAACAALEPQEQTAPLAVPAAAPAAGNGNDASGTAPCTVLNTPSEPPPAAPTGAAAETLTSTARLAEREAVFDSVPAGGHLHSAAPLAADVFLNSPATATVSDVDTQSKQCHKGFGALHVVSAGPSPPLSCCHSFNRRCYNDCDEPCNVKQVAPVQPSLPRQGPTISTTSRAGSGRISSSRSSSSNSSMRGSLSTRGSSSSGGGGARLYSSSVDLPKFQGLFDNSTASGGSTAGSSSKKGSSSDRSSGEGSNAGSSDGRDGSSAPADSGCSDGGHKGSSTNSSSGSGGNSSTTTTFTAAQPADKAASLRVQHLLLSAKLLKTAQAAAMAAFDQPETFLHEAGVCASEDEVLQLFEVR